MQDALALSDSQARSHSLRLREETRALIRRAWRAKPEKPRDGSSAGVPSYHGPSPDSPSSCFDMSETSETFETVSWTPAHAHAGTITSTHQYYHAGWTEATSLAWRARRPPRTKTPNATLKSPLLRPVSGTKQGSPAAQETARDPPLLQTDGPADLLTFTPSAAILPSSQALASSLRPLPFPTLHSLTDLDFAAQSPTFTHAISRQVTFAFHPLSSSMQGHPH